MHMSTVLYVGLGLISLIVVASLLWRFASRRYSLPCPVWLRYMVEMDNPFAKTLRAEVIVQHLDLQPGMTVLDIGCGPGRLTLPLAQQLGTQGKVVAIDVQPGMLDRARERAKAANLNNIRFLEIGLGNGILDVRSADRALLVTVLGEIPNREAALKEIFDALNPGGILSVSEMIFDPHFQRRKTVTQLAVATGFKEIAFFGNCLAFTLNLQKPPDGPVVKE
jgi:ubiquinone/menaquinone biosynthesis C-methylase UbiE